VVRLRCAPDELPRASILLGRFPYVIEALAAEKE
jgi:hypothetical protein